MPFILFNKPYNVQCQFSGPSPNLSDHIHTKDVYAAGRLDKRSEGLLILTDDGRLQSRITEPKMKLEKYYWVQLEGELKEGAYRYTQKRCQAQRWKRESFICEIN